MPCLWYQLDPFDDPATLFHYLELASRQLAPRRRPLPHFGNEHRENLPAFAQVFFQNLGDRLAPGSLVVFDNCHTLPAETPLYVALAMAADVLPQNCALLFISRADPPPEFARHRLNRNMLALGWEQLRFTAKESSSLIALWPESTLTTSDTLRLQAFTDGWAAGLSLMLEQSGLQPAATLTTEGATPPDAALFDYFACEIFANTATEAQHVLEVLAFPPFITLQMAVQLSGDPQAATILQEMHARNFFTEQVRDATTYRFHPLFRHFLLNRAKSRLDTRQSRALTVQAGRLFAANGDAEESATLFIEAEGWEELAPLIRRQATRLSAQGRSNTLLRWLRALPSWYRSSDPWFYFWEGHCLLPTAPAEAHYLFESAYRAFIEVGKPAGAFKSWSGAVESILHQWDDFSRLDRWIEGYETLKATFPRYFNPRIRARAHALLFGARLFRTPGDPRLDLLAEQTQTLIRLPFDLNQRLRIGAQLIRYYIWKGHFHKATVVVDRLRPTDKTKNLAPLTLIIWYHVEAFYLWFTQSQAASRAIVGKGLEVASRSGVHMLDLPLHAQGVYAALGMDDLPNARRHLETMKSLLRDNRSLDHSHYHYLAGWEAMLSDNLPLAIEHADSAWTLAMEAGTPFPATMALMERAQVLGELDRIGEAEEALEQALAYARSIDSTIMEYVCLLSVAHFALRRGQTGHGTAALSKALGLGRLHGYENALWWSAKGMADLCVIALRAGIEPDYVQRLVQRRNLLPSRPPLEIKNWPWPIRITALGPLTIYCHGEPLRFSGKSQRKPLELLKALIALGGQGVSREQLADALWPDTEGDAAITSLNTTLHRLRKLLSDDAAITLTGERLSLNPYRCWLDTQAFEQLADRLLAVLEGGREAPLAGEVETLTDHALALYTDSLFGGSGVDCWAVALRECLRDKFLRLLTAAGVYWETGRNWRKAEICYRRGLEIDPLAEVFYQQLMQNYLLQGRRAEGLAIYHRCREVLQAELDISPSSRSQELHRTLRKA